MQQDGDFYERLIGEAGEIYGESSYSPMLLLSGAFKHEFTEPLNTTERQAISDQLRLARLMMEEGKARSRGINNTIRDKIVEQREHISSRREEEDGLYSRAVGKFERALYGSFVVLYAQNVRDDLSQERILYLLERIVIPGLDIPDLEVLDVSKFGSATLLADFLEWQADQRLAKALRSKGQENPKPKVEETEKTEDKTLLELCDKSDEQFRLLQELGFEDKFIAEFQIWLEERRYNQALDPQNYTLELRKYIAAGLVRPVFRKGSGGVPELDRFETPTVDQLLEFIFIKSELVKVFDRNSGIVIFRRGFNTFQRLIKNGDNKNQISAIGCVAMVVQLVKEGKEDLAKDLVFSVRNLGRGMSEEIATILVGEIKTLLLPVVFNSNRE